MCGENVTNAVERDAMFQFLYIRQGLINLYKLNKSSGPYIAFSIWGGAMSLGEVENIHGRLAVVLSGGSGDMLPRGILVF